MVRVPFAWRGAVLGTLEVCLPVEVPEPDAAGLAMYANLADQAAAFVASQQSSAARERRRLGRELHDSVSYGVLSIIMRARAAQLAIVKEERGTSEQLGETLGAIAQIAREAHEELRALVMGLRQSPLKRGFAAAVRERAAELGEEWRLPVSVTESSPAPGLDPRTEAELYRIVSEALLNVVRHARASAAQVTIEHSTDRVTVTVADDGTGFQPGSGSPSHHGLSTMAERAEAIGARLEVRSVPDRGTTVTVVLECRGHQPEEAEDLQ
jgi:signal transduction histidine kinase